MNRALVSQDQDSNYYMATINIATLGLRFLASNKLNEIFMPSLEKLAQGTGELVRLSILQNDKLVWLSKAQGSKSSIKYDPINGMEVPLHVTAMGKSWLATLDEHKVERIILERGLGGLLLGPNAVKTLHDLKESLHLSKIQGYSLVEEEAEIGISAIAMIIPGDTVDRNIIGCVSVGGPSFRLSKQKLITFVPLIKETVQKISRIWPLRKFV